MLNRHPHCTSGGRLTWALVACPLGSAHLPFAPACSSDTLLPPLLACSTPDLGADASPLESAHESTEGGAAAAGGGGGGEGGTGVAFVVDAEVSSCRLGGLRLTTMSSCSGRYAGEASELSRARHAMLRLCSYYLSLHLFVAERTSMRCRQRAAVYLSVVPRHQRCRTCHWYCAGHRLPDAAIPLLAFCEGVDIYHLLSRNPLQVTGYLMMGALTPNCKKHSGGRPCCLGCMLRFAGAVSGHVCAC